MRRFRNDLARGIAPVLGLLAAWGTVVALAATSLPVVPVAGKQPGFSSLPPGETGILFTNVLAQDRYTTNQILLNGSGVAAGDVDGDGRCDLFFAGMGGKSALYRNLGGWRFQDITRESGVSCPTLDATGAVLVDIDGDGDLDLIVNSVGGGTLVFVNDSHGHFTAQEILDSDSAGMSLALGDIDGNGSLDLYIANYRPDTLRDQPNTNFRINMVNDKPVVAAVNGRPTTDPALAGRFTYRMNGGIVENGDVDILYRNDGHGHFTPVPFLGGAFLDEEGKPLAAEPHDWGLSVMMRDLDGDGVPDIYVCNDFDTPDRVWLNDGHGVFRAAPRLMFRNTSRFSMGIDIADINRDGYDDVFVLDMLARNRIRQMTRQDRSMEVTPLGAIENRPQLSRNTLQLNRGDNTFAEVAYYFDVAASDWSWTPIFLDVDLDGYEDLLITAGHGRDDNEIDVGSRIEAARRSKKLSSAELLGMRKGTPPLLAPQQLYHNLGGKGFEEVGRAWGFGEVGIGHGMCLADLDGDGDLDVVVNHLNGPAGIYRNESGAPRVAVRLKGSGPNTSGIGAKIRIYGGAVPMQSQEMISGGRYLSGDESMRVFAAGTLTNRMRIEVDWRSGKRTVVADVTANRIYEISETDAARVSKPVQRMAPTLFESAPLEHVHHEEAFDDFQRQPLLPRRLSQLGPGLAWLDVDGDGLDDLVIGSGKGGAITIYRNEGQGNLVQTNFAATVGMLARDSSGLVGWHDRAGRVQLFAGSSNYEDANSGEGGVASYDLTKNAVLTNLVIKGASVGALALGDIAGDGTLTLFVAGRVTGGRYPEPAGSGLYRRSGEQWQLDAANSPILKDVGMVSGAVWTDLDGDGYPELVLACEWGALKIYKNEKGRLKDAKKDWGLSGHTGWWNGVTAGDFDGDGKMDLIASNWGLNTKYRANATHPRRMYYGNLSGQGLVEMVEAVYDLDFGKWMPERDLNALAAVFPYLKERYPLHRDYAQAGIEEVLAGHLGEAKLLEATRLETTVFLNRGDHFELGQMPSEAQYSPAFAVNVADLDGDGNEDIFLSQNFFDLPVVTSRSDAGRGLVLKGDGQGGFAAVAGQLSGITVYGEQRGSALCDYDGDGRVDLAVSQNGAATRLWHNRGAKPGLRVKLEGVDGNRDAVGAVLRLAFGTNEWGPAREIHAGSGYWSQDSAVQVLALPKPATQLEVRWPGGKTTITRLPAQATQVTIRSDGTLLEK